MGRKINFFLSVLLMLLFGMGLNTCSYASVTKEYIDWGINNLYENGNFIYNGSSYNTIFDKILKYIIDNPNISQDLYDNLTEYQDNNNLSSLTNVNLQVLPFYNGNSGIKLYFVFSNSTANSGVNNLGYLYFYRYSSELDYIKCYGETSDVLYIFQFNGIWQNSTNTLSVSYENSTLNTSQTKAVLVDSPSFNEELTVFTQNNLSCAGLPSAYVPYPFEKNGSLRYMIIKGKTGNYIEPTPEEPENPEEPGESGTTGTITNPSGDTTGKVNLSGIEQGIGDINQNIDKTNEKLDGISGEIGKLNENLTTVPDISDKTITSEDITSSFDFEFAEDPYANFWLELTTGLSGALTNNVRSIDVQFRGETYKIELDKFAIQTPEFLKSFLAILSTVFIFWKMIKYWKIIIDNITSGNMDEVLEMNEEERYY